MFRILIIVLTNKFVIRTTDAKNEVLAIGKARHAQLQKALENVLLKRNKSIVLEDELPTKSQKVKVTCISFSFLFVYTNY